MSFDVRIPNILKRKQKNRIKKSILFYNSNFKYFSIVSLNSYRLYVSRLKVLNLFLTKCVKKFRRISKKDKFRKVFGEDIIIRHFINKQKMYVFGISALFEGSKKTRELLKIILRARRRGIRLKKVQRVARSFICFNLPKIPFTRKPTGARMGKGKGAIRAWFIRIFPGCNIITLKNWKTKPSFYILNLIKLFLPGKNYVTRPWFFKRRVFLNNLINFI